ncbi:UvrD-helicase domain-containing protein [Undibacterium arcticum]
MLDALLLPEATATSISLSPPSPDQLAAAMAEERAANVVAGPGTGKTTTLIHRVKYLVEVKKVHPSQIIVLTFTNKAAFELVERLRSAGINDAAEIWAGTFHAFGLEFLRKYHQRFWTRCRLERGGPSFVYDHVGSRAPPRGPNPFFSRVEDPYEWLSPVIESITRLKEELVTSADYRHFVESHPIQDLELQRKKGWTLQRSTSCMRPCL